MEHSYVELRNPNEIEEEEQVADEDEETDNYYPLGRYRSIRVIKPPQRLSYINLIVFSLIFGSEVLDEEPRDYKEVMRSRNKIEWMKAMDDEMKYLHDNHIWELIKKPVGARLVNYKWIFKVKEGIK